MAQLIYSGFTPNDDLHSYVAVYQRATYIQANIGLIGGMTVDSHGFLT